MTSSVRETCNIIIHSFVLREAERDKERRLLFNDTHLIKEHLYYNNNIILYSQSGIEHVHVQYKTYKKKKEKNQKVHK